MKQYFIIFFTILAASAVGWIGVALSYRGGVPPSNDYVDWAGPHTIIDWPGIALLITGIAVVSLIVWIILRKGKRNSS